MDAGEVPVDSGTDVDADERAAIEWASGLDKESPQAGSREHVRHNPAQSPVAAPETRVIASKPSALVFPRPKVEPAFFTPATAAREKRRLHNLI